LPQGARWRKQALPAGNAVKPRSRGGGSSPRRASAGPDRLRWAGHKGAMITKLSKIGITVVSNPLGGIGDCSARERKTRWSANSGCGRAASPLATKMKRRPRLTCPAYHPDKTRFDEGPTMMAEDGPDDEAHFARWPKPPARSAAQKTAAEQRLKSALRDNLRRRKAQARGRGENLGAAADADGPARQDK